MYKLYRNDSVSYSRKRAHMICYGINTGCVVGSVFGVPIILSNISHLLPEIFAGPICFGGLILWFIGTPLTCKYALENMKEEHKRFYELGKRIHKRKTLKEQGFLTPDELFEQQIQQQLQQIPTQELGGHQKVLRFPENKQ